MEQQFVTRDRYASNDDFGGNYRVYLLCYDYELGEPYGRINSLDTLLFRLFVVVLKQSFLQTFFMLSKFVRLSLQIIPVQFYRLFACCAAPYCVLVSSTDIP